MRQFFVGDKPWETPTNGQAKSDKTYQWGAAGQKDGFIGSYDVACVGPGFIYNGNPQRRIDRKDGALYRSAWTAALQSRKLWVFIET